MSLCHPVPPAQPPVQGSIWVSGRDGAGLPPAGGQAQRILICCHDFSRGGTERIAIGLARHWVDAGREVAFLCGTTEGGLRATVDPRVPVIELDPPIRRSLTSRLKLARAMAARLAEIDPDIIFLPGNFHLMLAPALRKAARGAIIVKISNPTVPSGLLAMPVRALLARFRDCVDGVAAMNSGLEADIAALLPGIAVRTLFDPVYLSHAPAPHAPAGEGALEIVWAGRFEPQKDVMLALRTIKALSERARVRLTLLGDGSQRRRVIRAIGALGLSEIVAAPGFVAGIDAWLTRADALLVTSHYEGGPAVAVEALAHGVPVVATDCSHFLRDIMAIPAAGRIVTTRKPRDLAAALAEVCKAGRPDAGALAALTAHLEPDVCAAAYLDWFDAVAAARAGKPSLQPAPPCA